MPEPRIRFKRDDGSSFPPLITSTLGELTRNVIEKNGTNSNLPVYSVNNQKGFLPQIDQFDERMVASSDRSNYRIVDFHQFAYNPSRINVGSIAYLKENKKVIVSPLYIVFECNEKLIPEYLNEYVRTNSFNNKRKMNTVGSVRDSLSYEGFSEIEIDLPCVEEQKRVVELLSSVDNVIATCEKELMQVMELKRGMLQKMFPRKGETVPEIRFPGYIDEWEQRKLGELAEIGDIDHRMPSTVDDGIPYLMTGDFCGINDLNFEGVKHISKEDYEMLSRKIRPEKGDIIFARYASVGAVRYIDFTKDFLISYSCAIIKKSLNIDSKYLYHFLTTDTAKKQIKLEINTGSQANIGIDSMKNRIVVSMPTEQEQAKISSFLDNIDNLITLHQRELDKWKELKKGLLQQMFV